MRLSKIKLAGFKSFVDPTIINFNSNLTGIVGPNGCGKSNTIDAVRWVMGESSAKHLRGISMDDVIFNGSSTRKPIDSASVELVFDNTQGKLGGQYASYSEISVKRQVSRDGQSKYSLNGTRCRRRDVADLFLGTGLGPRSYAIIEQGMISRLIEAKPEELRSFLEEAAGISKYKERRRETETRIRRTRENLERLSDLNEEIEKQLARLQRQSRSAERYKTLKSEEREQKAEHLSLCWRELKVDLDQRDKQIQNTETNLEKVMAQIRAVESKIESDRDHAIQSNDIYNTIQANFYRIGSDISTKEQRITHQKELAQRQQNDLSQIIIALSEMAQVITSDGIAVQQLQQNIQQDEPKLQALQSQEQEIKQSYQHAENNVQNWQQQWEHINQKYSQQSQTAQLEKSRIIQFERQLAQHNTRHDKIEIEKQALQGENISEQIFDLEKLLKKHQDEREDGQQQLTQTLNHIKSNREQINQCEQRFAEVRRKSHQCQGSLSSMEALQEAALGKTDKSSQQWLIKNGIHENTRLAEKLNVETGWELAVETVLGETLEAVCVDNIEHFCQSFDSLQQSNMSLLENKTNSNLTTQESLSEKLLQKVSSTIDLSQHLSHVHCTETLEQALKLRHQLKNNESIICQQGVWLGANWLRISRAKDNNTGVITRENRIRELTKNLSELDSQGEKVSLELKNSRENLQTKEQKREELQTQLNSTHTRLNEVKAQISARQTQHEHVIKRDKNLNLELEEIQNLIKSDETEISTATKNRNQALHLAEEMEVERKNLQEQRDDYQKTLEQHRSNLQHHQQQSHQLAIKFESEKTRLNSLHHNIKRMQQTHDGQLQRQSELEQLQSQSNKPIEKLEEELKVLLEQRLSSEQSLVEAKQKSDNLNASIKLLEKQKTELDEQSNTIRQQLEKYRIAIQETRVRSQTITEQLEKTAYQLDVLLEKLPPDVTPQQWEAKLAEIATKISRLGAINLAAIDEYQEQLKRKEYLDEQSKDVNGALDILVKAIEKIDKETRHRFKETYDHVNSRIKEMFPRLFGGGTAYLEMTGDDLLSTGVAIMARPPGKRISNIHLMSGGEKALTAVALVFAIFELNPAPFCMLDEVDAPLDEANVGRYCQLVKEMSSRVQFIFITHNKTTMEMSENLCGVTMRESGVSRLVSVNVAEAATFAGVEA